jgi:predicted MFS family arabinose efflux permease
LAIPAVLALAVLVAARLLYPSPRDLETGTPQLETKGFPRAYWLYLAAVALIAAGYADFPLIAYHFQTRTGIPQTWIPVFYAVAMGTDALAALVLGRLYDRLGLSVLVAVSLLSAAFAPLVFLGGFSLALGGMAIWGVGMGAQESIVRAAVAEMAPAGRRAAAYGVFNAGYGLFWFAGSALMGVLYDIYLPALILFSVVMQLASIPLLLKVGRGGEPPRAGSGPLKG